MIFCPPTSANIAPFQNVEQSPRNGQQVTFSAVPPHWHFSQPHSETFEDKCHVLIDGILHFTFILTLFIPIVRKFHTYDRFDVKWWLFPQFSSLESKAIFREKGLPKFLRMYLQRSDNDVTQTSLVILPISAFQGPSRSTPTWGPHGKIIRVRFVNSGVAHVNFQRLHQISRWLQCPSYQMIDELNS